ncbi:MAG: hypothetical protein AAGI54_11635 [Planctomycetota bacterium]
MRELRDGMSGPTVNGRAASPATVRAEPTLDRWAGLVADGGRVWTGHQPYLWHPGILAKYIAGDAVASTDGVVDLVVDHDTHDAGVIELPTRVGKRWGVRRLRLGPCRADVPLGMQPGMGADGAIAALRGAADDAESAGARVARLVEAFDQVGRGHATLADQMAAVLAWLRTRWVVAPVDTVRSTTLGRDGVLVGWVERMASDAERCVAAYNAAVRAEVAAGGGGGVRELRVEPWRVELPLWRVGWMQPRQGVWADVADSRAVLTLEDGTPLHAPDEPAAGVAGLAPRALLMTAIVRSRDDCGLFVHGTGGGVYDRITDRWWRDWLGDRAPRLAPTAVVTADLRLASEGLSVATPADVRRGLWRLHHASHNIDRALELSADEPAVREKRIALGRLHGPGVWGEGQRVEDAAQRRAAWAALKRANARLAADHPEALAAAEAAYRSARVGVENSAVAAKRDWSIGVMPAASLEALSSMIRERVGATPAIGSHTA